MSTAEKKITDERSLGDFERKFLEFHRENPRVYKELLRLTRQAKNNKGGKRIGIRMLWEVMRWNLTILTYDPSSDFKLNNNYHSRYARLIVEKNPDLKGLFEFRELRTALVLKEYLYVMPLSALKNPAPQRNDVPKHLPVAELMAPSGNE